MPSDILSTPLNPENNPSESACHRSRYEIAKLAINTTILSLTSTLLITDPARIFFVAQPKMDILGDNLRKYGNPVAPTHLALTETCSDLNVGEYAKVELATQKNPNIVVGQTNQTSQVLANTESAQFNSLLFNLQWFTALTCHRTDTSAMRIMGSAYFGGKETAEYKKTGFPLYDVTTDTTPTLFTNNKTAIASGLAVAFMAFCKLIQEGGENLSKQGEVTNGFENDFATTLEKFAFFIAAFSLLAAGSAAVNVISSVKNLFFTDREMRNDDVSATPDINNYPSTRSTVSDIYENPSLMTTAASSRRESP